MPHELAQQSNYDKKWYDHAEQDKIGIDEIDAHVGYLIRLAFGMTFRNSSGDSGGGITSLMARYISQMYIIGTSSGFCWCAIRLANLRVASLLMVSILLLFGFIREVFVWYVTVSHECDV